MTTTARAASSPPSGVLGALAQAGIFVFGIVMALVGAVVPTLSERLSLTLGDVGTIFLVMNSAMLAASLVLGLIVDRGGLKLPLAAGALLVAAGLVLVGGAASYGVVLAGGVCLGLGGGALNGGTNTLVADLYEDERRKAAALNLLGVFFGFGALLLPFTLGALMSRFGMDRLLYAGAVLCVAIGLTATVLVFPRPKQRQGVPLAAMARFARMPVVLVIGALLFFQSGNEFLLGGYITTLLTRELGASIGAASYWLAAYWASIMVARLVLSRALLRVSAPAVVLGSAIVAAAGGLVIASAPTVTVAVFGAVVTGLALAGIFPTVLGLAGARFREHSGTVFGLLFAMALSGGILVPWTSGHLAEAAGVRSVFILASANFASVGILSLVVRRMLGRTR